MFELRLEDIKKKFTHKTVLRGISISFFEGEIHSLLGENGAGKSTLAAIMSGFTQANSGCFFCSGKKIKIKTVHDAINSGIAIVHQNPRLAEELPLWQNIILGSERRALFGLLDRGSECARISKIARDWGIDLLLTAKTASLSASDRFYTALLAALHKKPKLLILDEPSAALDPQQRKFFYKALAGAASRGLSILLITHNIEEAIKYSDKISVLNQGILQKTLTNKPRSVSVGSIQRLMFEKDSFIKKKPAKRLSGSHSGKIVLRVRNVHVLSQNGVSLSDVHIQAQSGDITVIGGKNSTALKVLEDILTGMYTAPFFGTVSIRSKPLARVTAAALRAAKTALVPSDKIRRASNPAISVYDMLIPLYAGGRSFAHKLVDSEDIAINLDESVSHLSGGMLQRLIIAREFAQKPKLIILCEPAAGLDRKSESRLWESLRSAADSGCAVVVLTSDTAGVTPYADKFYGIEGGTVRVQ